MRFVPNLSVRTRLSVAFLSVILLGWALNTATFRYLLEQDIQRDRHERTVQAERPGRHDPAAHAAHRTRVMFRALPIQVSIAIVLSLAAGAWLSRRFTRPLDQLEQGAHAFHERRFQHRIPREGNDEFARVAASMNEMAERVEAQIAALETDARRRKQLLADVAHELRSPVATLKTMAEALRDGIAAQPDRRERALTTMIAMADRMQRLVTDLMELAKLDLRDLPLHTCSMDLTHVAAESIAVHAEAAARAGVCLHPLQSNAPVPITGDPLRIGQVIDNLIANAIDHSGEGSNVRVAVVEGDPAVVTVQDTGRGIPADQLPFVFDPFYRGDAARTPGDHHSGLGLRIARGLAEAHGGALTIESREGHGTTATLTLPVKGPAGTDSTADV